jgi:hypothetical protein
MHISTINALLRPNPPGDPGVCRQNSVKQQTQEFNLGSEQALLF